MKGTVFIDRDGTIIKEKGYISMTEQVELLTGVPEAIKLLRSNRFKIIILTNQSGVSRGYFTLYTLKKINHRLFELLKENGTYVDALYFCPHKPEDNCNCRKPKTGMIEQARRDLDIDLGHSYVIGDQSADIELGNRMGLSTILVLTGYGEESRPKVNPNFIATNLLEAAHLICREK